MAPPAFRSTRRSLATTRQNSGERPTPLVTAGPAGAGPRGSVMVWWRRPPRRSVVLGAAAAACAALLLGLLLMDQMAVAAPEQAREAAAPTHLSTGRLFAALPWGTGEGQVGRATPSEGLDRGPEALAMAPDGRVAILDSVNRRVVVLDANGQPLRTFAVPLASPRFLAVTNERLAVLDPDDTEQVIVTDWSGAVLLTRDLPQSDQPATGVFLHMGQVWMETGHSRCLLLSGPADRPGIREQRAGRPVAAGGSGTWMSATLAANGGPLVETIAEGATISMAATSDIADSEQVTSTASETDFGLPVEHLVSLEADGAGRVLVGARAADAGQARFVVARFQPGTLATQSTAGRAKAGSDNAARGRARPESLLVFQEAPGPYLGAPFVTAPDGSVLQPVGDRDSYRILVHRFPEGD